MLKVSLFALAVFIGHLSLWAQVPSGGFPESKEKPFSDGLGKPDFNISVGSQVGTSFNHDYWFTNYIAPSVSLDLTKRFTMVLGTGAAYTSYNTGSFTGNPERGEIYPVNSMSLFAYASGIYKLNAKTSLSGNVLLEQVNVNGDNFTKAKYNLTDFSVGFHYKPTSNVQFHAMFGMSSYPNPMLPTNNSYFGNSTNPIFNSMPIFW